MAREAGFSLAHFSMPTAPDQSMPALFDLPVDDIDDVGGAREAVDQIGEYSADDDCGDWQSFGAHGRILLVRPRQGVARNLNDRLLLADSDEVAKAIRDHVDLPALPTKMRGAPTADKDNDLDACPATAGQHGRDRLLGGGDF